MGHGTVYACKGPHANEAPFSRLLRREDPLYDSHAVSMLAGPHGPISLAASGSTAKQAMPAGFTFFGQFVDHDLTEFRAVQERRALPMNPQLGVRQSVAGDPGEITATNGRTGLFDLDSVYGLLGEPDAALFDGEGLFIVGAEPRTIGNFTAPRDIRRDSDYRDGRMIADPRNDENKLILQIHLLFMRLHNLVHGDKPGTHPVGSPEFAASCATVKAVYHRIVLCDYLPRLVRQLEIAPVVDRLLAGTAFYSDMTRRVRAAEACPPGAAPMPVEFAQACFRLGHSQLRQGYALNASQSLPLFATGGPDLRGRQALTAQTEVEWSRFFGSTAQHGEPLDARLPEATFRLPPPAVDAPPQSLAERNIRRGADFGVASGQTCAVALKARYPHIAEPMTPAELGLSAEITGVDPGLATQTPLWFYILREAQERNPAGPELGEVGGLIVAETMLGALLAGGADVSLAVGAVPNDNDPTTAPAVDKVKSMTGLLKLLGEL